MKAGLVLALLAVVGFVLAGCGSGTTHTNSGTTESRTITVGPVTLVGTTTIAHMPTGTPIHCKHGPGAEVPKLGEGVGGSADGPNSSGEIQVTHRRDGSVVASCRSG
jgi:hypothetical protein